MPQMKLDVDRLKHAAPKACLQIRPQDDSYLRSYCFFVEYLASRPVIEDKDVVISAHFVYGWMPTILEMGSTDLNEAARILNALREKPGAADVAQLGALKELINGSMVGTSKLLHFLAPSSFSIWDRKVYRFLFEKFSYSGIQDIQNYLRYIERLREVTGDVQYNSTHHQVCQHLGTSVSRLRSAELIMFMNG